MLPLSSLSSILEAVAAALPSTKGSCQQGMSALLDDAGLQDHIGLKRLRDWTRP